MKEANKNSFRYGRNTKLVMTIWKHGKVSLMTDTLLNIPG